VTEFHDRGERNIALVYSYKKGTSYPFAPRPGKTRDHNLELNFRDALKGTLPLETDLAQWFPVWDAPGL
jgi:PspAB-like protein